ncbi:envelope stress response membrane protein PspB [uncultured Photobacterium sp.]|uniref:envelope stress response membrane protein PspB n=1 Tax=uncultured Photobacterium sp. TaxID=173973 RepID=UPI0026203D9F|nr:envelope stress response membrane protein PspB [uncultured Photobacterium sp.]
MGWIVWPLMAFLIFVAPLWLILHYRSQRHASRGLSGEEQEKLQTLVARAEQMQERITTLEQILDEEAPQWRQRQ